MRLIAIQAVSLATLLHVSVEVRAGPLLPKRTVLLYSLKYVGPSSHPIRQSSAIRRWSYCKERNHLYYLYAIGTPPTPRR